jgi:hypothetical protein
MAIAAVGLLAAAVPLALFGPGAGADTPDKHPGSHEVIDPVQIGKISQLKDDLSVDRPSDVLRYPDARFVKVHFKDLKLPAGDYVTVSNRDGSESYRYERPSDGMWATSVTGDTAVVRLHGKDGRLSGAADKLNADIDKVSRGLSPREVRAKQEKQRRTESVCGGDDSKDVACYKSSQPTEYEHAAPVARLLIGGNTLCTAWRVGPNNRMLTNHHCFSSTAQARDTEVWFNYQCLICGADVAEDPVKVNGSKVIATDETYDYTLFSVDDFSKISRFGHLTLADRQARSGEELYIPQHPNGEPTKLAIDSDVDNGACKVDDPTFDGYATASDVSYRCDTDFGSSGSPVLSRSTHEVIALHHFGGCPNSGVRSDKLLDRIGSKL